MKTAAPSTGAAFFTPFRDFIRLCIREKPDYLIGMGWSALLRWVYTLMLCMLGLLYLAIMLAQLQAAQMAHALSLGHLAFGSTLWLSPGLLALVSAWRFWVAMQTPKRRISAIFWALLTPIYALAIGLISAGPVWLKRRVIDPWDWTEVLQEGPQGDPVAASIWLAVLILVLGGLLLILALWYQPKPPRQSGY